MKRRVATLAMVLAALSAGELSAQYVGPFFRVHPISPDTQGTARVAYHTDGRFVVTWINSVSGQQRLFAQRFSASGAPLGLPLQVQAFTTLLPILPSVSVASNGADYVVVWELETAGIDRDIFARRFTFNGPAIGVEFRVNTITSGIQNDPGVASYGSGFVITWSHTTNIADLPKGVYGRRFTSLGQPLTGDYRVSTVDTAMSTTSVAVDANGKTLAAWFQGGDLWGRRFASNGAPETEPFEIGLAHPYDLAGLPTGGFVVVRESSDGSGYGIEMLRYSSAGAPLGDATRVNTATANDQEIPSVAVSPSGIFLVSWQSPGSVSSGQFFGPDATPINGEFTSAAFHGEDAAAAAGGFIVVGSAAGDAFAQRLWPAPLNVGSEFRVNGTFYPSIVEEPSGEYVVAWYGNPGFVVQRLSATGTPVGAPLAVPPSNPDNLRPSLASDSNGGFILVWAQFAVTAYDVFAQRVSSSITALGTPFRVNTSTTLHQKSPTAARTADGFVVVWSSATGDGDGYAVFGRRFASDGQPLAAEFVVNTTTTGNQRYPVVAGNAAGGFVVTWLDGTAFTVFARRYSSDGSPAGLGFQVNSATNTLRQALDVHTDGSFVVAWGALGLDGSMRGIAARRFAGSGDALGGEFQVNVYTTGYQEKPSVSIDDHGRFVIAWQGRVGAVGSYGIFEQVYKASGEPLGANFRVNSATSSTRAPSVVLGEKWLTMWDQNNGSGGVDLHALFLTPPCRSSDADGNGSTNVVDILYLINHLFAGGPPPLCGGDADGNGIVNVADVLFLINFLFAGGPPPA